MGAPLKSLPEDGGQEPIIATFSPANYSANIADINYDPILVRLDRIIRFQRRLDNRMDGIERRLDRLERLIERRMNGSNRRLVGLIRRVDRLERRILPQNPPQNQ